MDINESRTFYEWGLIRVKLEYRGFQSCWEFLNKEMGHDMNGQLGKIS